MKVQPTGHLLILNSFTNQFLLVQWSPIEYICIYNVWIIWAFWENFRGSLLFTVLCVWFFLLSLNPYLCLSTRLTHLFRHPSRLFSFLFSELLIFSCTNILHSFPRYLSLSLTHFLSFLFSVSIILRYCSLFCWYFSNWN